MSDELRRLADEVDKVMQIVVDLAACNPLEEGGHPACTLCQEREFHADTCPWLRSVRAVDYLRWAKGR